MTKAFMARHISHGNRGASITVTLKGKTAWAMLNMFQGHELEMEILRPWIDDTVFRIPKRFETIHFYYRGRHVELKRC